MLQTTRDNILDLGKSPQRSTGPWADSACGQEHQLRTISHQGKLRIRHKIKGQNKWHGMRRTWDHNSGCLVRRLGLDRRANTSNFPVISFFFAVPWPMLLIYTYYFGIIFSLWIQIKASSHVAGRALDLCLFNSTCFLK